MKYTLHYVRCKAHPRSKLKSWIMHMSGIYSICNKCGAETGFDKCEGGYSAHYDLFQIVVSKARGESYEEMCARADQLVKADPKTYQVDEHSDPVMEARGRRTK